MIFLVSSVWYAVAGFSAVAVAVSCFVWLRHRVAAATLYGTGADGLAPENPVAVADALANLGRFHHEMSEYEPAVVLYNRALELCPEARGARLNRDRALAKLSWSGDGAGAGRKGEAAPSAPLKPAPAKTAAPPPVERTAPQVPPAPGKTASAAPAPQAPVTRPSPSSAPQEKAIPLSLLKQAAPTMAEPGGGPPLPSFPAPPGEKKAAKSQPPAPASPQTAQAPQPEKLSTLVPRLEQPAKPAIRGETVAVLQQAGKFLENGEADKALKIFDAVLAQHGNNAEALKGRGQVFMQKNLLNEAVRDFSAALRLQPQSADVFNFRGIALSRMGKSAEAAQDFQALTQLAPGLIGTDPAHADLLLTQAVTHFKLEAFDRALLRLDKVLTLTPDNTQARLYRGMTYERKGMIEEAIKDFDQVVETAPDSAEACWRRGEVYMRKNLYRNAMQDFIKALERDPLCVEALHGRGRIAARKGLHRDAIEDFSRALGREPNNADILFARGLEYKMDGKFEQALADFRSACDLGRADALAEYEKMQAIMRQAVAGSGAGA